MKKKVNLSLIFKKNREKNSKISLRSWINIVLFLIILISLATKDVSNGLVIWFIFIFLIFIWSNLYFQISEVDSSDDEQIWQKIGIIADFIAYFIIIVAIALFRSDSRLVLHILKQLPKYYVFIPAFLIGVVAQYHLLNLQAKQESAIMNGKFFNVLPPAFFSLLLIIWTGLVLSNAFSPNTNSPTGSNNQGFSATLSTSSFFFNDRVSTTFFNASLTINYSDSNAANNNMESKDKNEQSKDKIKESIIFLTMLYSGFNISTPYIEALLKKRYEEATAPTKHGPVRKRKRQRRRKKYN